MTVLESIILMCCLLYSVNLLYRSNKQWGSWLTLALLILALFLTLYWPLFLGGAIGLGGWAVLHKYKPQLASGSVRENELRDWVQHMMALAMFLVGVQYVVYYGLLSKEIIPGFGRPDVVDAFLPIAGGLQIKAIITLNLWDQNHPAAAVMLFAVLLTGVLCKRAFCGWICPLGLVSQYIYDWRVKLIKGEANPPAWLDWPLRMLKYLLLAGMMYIVLFSMPARALPYYLNGYYQKIADLKMGMFFITPSLIEGVLIGLVIVSTAGQKRAFCRYLCPYGALLGLLSFLSPFKVRRDTAHCIIDAKGMSCDKCTRACPARIQVHNKITVRSDECQACMRCISACPNKGALALKTRRGTTLSARGVLIILLLVMFGVPLAFYTTGYWHSMVTDEMRMELMKYLHQISY